MPKRPLVLNRVRADGVVYDVVVANLRDARKRVAWCMHYNGGTDRREASAVADRLQQGIPLTAYGYTFTLARGEVE